MEGKSIRRMEWTWQSFLVQSPQGRGRPSDHTQVTRLVNGRAEFELGLDGNCPDLIHFSLLPASVTSRKIKLQRLLFQVCNSFP